jgi:hypothetical protein
MPFDPPNSSAAGDVNDGFGIQSVEEEAELRYGPWGECSAACGDGWQTRAAACVAPTGAMLAMEQCPGAGRAVTSRPCRCGVLRVLLKLRDSGWCIALAIAGLPGCRCLGQAACLVTAVVRLPAMLK